MAKFDLFKKLLTMLIFSEDLGKKCHIFGEMTAFYIFNYLWEFSTNVSKNDLGSYDIITVAALQSNVWT